MSYSARRMTCETQPYVARLTRLGAVAADLGRGIQFAVLLWRLKQNGLREADSK